MEETSSIVRTAIRDDFKVQGTMKVGTYLYLSEEAFTGEFSTKSDVYACGVILFELWRPNPNPNPQPDPTPNPVA